MFVVGGVVLVVTITQQLNPCEAICQRVDDTSSGDSKGPFAFAHLNGVAAVFHGY